MRNRRIAAAEARFAKDRAKVALIKRYRKEKETASAFERESYETRRWREVDAQAEMRYYN